MKKQDMKVKILTLTMMSVMSVSALYAGPGHNHEGREGHKDWGGEQRLEKLTKKLELSADQQAKIKQIMDETRAQAKALWEKSDEQLQAVLTDDQKKKYVDMKSKMKEKMEDRKEKKSKKDK